MRRYDVDRNINLKENYWNLSRQQSFIACYTVNCMVYSAQNMLIHLANNAIRSRGKRNLKPASKLLYSLLL